MSVRQRIRERKQFSRRTVVLSILLVAVMLIYSFSLLNYQIINAADYSNQARGAYSRTAVIKAARGEILDRYGRQFAVNRNGYDIVFNSAYLDRSQLNNIISRLMEVMNEFGEKWNDDLPLTYEEPFDFTDEGTAKSTLLRTLDVAHYATAEDCFTQLIERYSLEGMDTKTQRLLAGVRYTMEIANFSVANPYSFASDISEKLMLRISESGFMLDGVVISNVPVREYVQGDLASNIIGTVGSMNADQWQEYKELGYSYSDKIGVTGIEAAYEEYLHGTDGEMTYTYDGDGNIVSSEVTKEPIPGNTLILSLDKNLQVKTQTALGELITSLNSQGGTATGGAAVAIDIKSGEVILAATYPTFDINQYFTNYTELANQKNSPLTNRAFAGVYPPGSSLKPIMGIAALETGALAEDEHIFCKRVYEYYASVGYTPSCMGRHGSIGINTALSKSCNYFFFEIGRRMGINTINSYLYKFGLGEKTGVEVYESQGILDDAQGDWFGGDTLQVSIGQHNAFTPIQICSATATIANGGTRYKTTLVNKIMSYDLNSTYYELSPEVKSSFSIEPAVLNAVKEGMLSVTEDGTGSTVFKDYDIKIGGKTGTAQTDSGADHNIFVAFAPYDDPQIAVAVVIEHGASSYTSGSVMKAIMNAYFFNEDDSNGQDNVNLPLK